ncbi:MAG: glycosyltransferase family 4 protein [Patescibacteria group bacterium]|jgi:phosphatidylinositol alpha-mannosyltransferase
MKNKLKIAMIFSSDPSQAGGVQEHIAYLSKELKKLGHRVDVYGPEKNIYPYINYHPISKVVILPVPNGNWANITVKNDEKHEVAEIIEKGKFDIIHIHEPYIPFINWDIYKNTTAVKISTFHTAWNNDSIINLINPFLTFFKETFSSYFKAAIFVSKIGKKRWKDLCEINVIQKVIYNAVDNTVFTPVKKDKNKIINLLFVGRIVNRKGLKYLLKAIKKIVINYSNIKLTVIGDGPEKLKLEEYVRNNKLNRFVEFKGEILGKERIGFYQKADIFCAPYTDEAFGITILEALSCGIPVVGFKNEAFLEILKGYPYPRLFVTNKNVLRLSEALRELIKNEKKREEIGKWGIERVKEFNWIKTAKETEELYHRILKT